MNDKTEEVGKAVEETEAKASFSRRKLDSELTVMGKIRNLIEDLENPMAAKRVLHWNLARVCEDQSDDDLIRHELGKMAAVAVDQIARIHDSAHQSALQGAVHTPPSTF